LLLLKTATTEGPLVWETVMAWRRHFLDSTASKVLAVEETPAEIVVMVETTT